MEVKNIWNDQIPEKDGVKLAVNDIAFSPGNIFHFHQSHASFYKFTIYSI